MTNEELDEAAAKADDLAPGAIIAILLMIPVMLSLAAFDRIKAILKPAGPRL